MSKLEHHRHHRQSTQSERRLNRRAFIRISVHLPQAHATRITPDRDVEPVRALGLATPEGLGCVEGGAANAGFIPALKLELCVATSTPPAIPVSINYHSRARKLAIELVFRDCEFSALAPLFLM